MGTPIENNTTSLQELLAKAQGLPTGGQSDVVMQNITLSATGWVEDAENGMFTQGVSNENIGESTLIDLFPDATVLRQLAQDGVTAIYAKNDSGTATVVALDASPTVEIVMQVGFVEVETGE